MNSTGSHVEVENFGVGECGLCCKKSDILVGLSSHLSQSSHHMDSQVPFKWRHFLPDVILLNVRWYSRYSLSYRNLEEMTLERGVEIDHTTIYRWVQAYSPELDKRTRHHLSFTNDS